MVHENSLNNLNKPPKGSPKVPGSGRKKGTLNLKQVIQKWLSVKEDIDPAQLPILRRRAKLTQLDIMTLKQVAKARNGDTRAYQELMDRGFGKPDQLISNEFPEGTIIEVSVGRPLIPGEKQKMQTDEPEITGVINDGTPDAD